MQNNIPILCIYVWFIPLNYNFISIKTSNSKSAVRIIQWLSKMKLKKIFYLDFFLILIFVSTQRHKNILFLYYSQQKIMVLSVKVLSQTSQTCKEMCLHTKVNDCKHCNKMAVGSCTVFVCWQINYKMEKKTWNMWQVKYEIGSNQVGHESQKFMKVGKSPWFF